MLLNCILLGPISSGSPRGQGPVFSILFVFVGSWILVRTWKDYLAHPRDSRIPPFDVLGITGLAAFFIVSGVWSLVHCG